MAVDNIKLSFSDRFEGSVQTPNGNLPIGVNAFEPYHLLFGALGSCFYATFLSIAKKKRLRFSGVEIEISGVKRESVPQTLERVEILLKVFNPSDEKQFIRSAELGAEYCSIHETVSRVAAIDLKVDFVYK